MARHERPAVRFVIFGVDAGFTMRTFVRMETLRTPDLSTPPQSAHETALALCSSTPPKPSARKVSPGTLAAAIFRFAARLIASSLSSPALAAKDTGFPD